MGIVNKLQPKLWDIIKGIKKHDTYYLREGRKISKLTLLKKGGKSITIIYNCDLTCVGGYMCIFR